MIYKIFSFIVILSLVLPSLASSVIFDTAAAKQAEWNSYLQYKQDYVKFNNLQGFTDVLSERNLENEFGFYGPSHYYISPQAWNAKYNPPLQGYTYETANRGYTSSLASPSAVKYYGEKVNGRYTGPIPTDLNGVYFDHPQANVNGAYGVVTYNYNYGSQLSGYPNDAKYYARIAGQNPDEYYIAGFY